MQSENSCDHLTKIARKRHRIRELNQPDGNIADDKREIRREREGEKERKKEDKRQKRRRERKRRDGERDEKQAKKHGYGETEKEMAGDMEMQMERDG